MNKVSTKYSLEWVATIIAFTGACAVLQTFILGRHFVIPTILLALTILFANLARYGFRDEPLAKHALFWITAIICCHTFFALFWAKTPRELLGVWFYPVYGIVCVGSGLLAWRYAAANRLFVRRNT